MRLDVSLQQRLSQQLRLAPQIIQSIEILQLPAMDLRELIENELQENEVLEVEEVPRDPALAVEERGPSADEEGTDDDAERVFDRLEGLLDADRSRGRLSPMESSMSTMNGTSANSFFNSAVTARRVAASGP